MTEQASPAPNVVKAGAKGKSNAEINAELRVRAAKQAAKERAALAKTAKDAAAELAKADMIAPPPSDTIRVKVTRRGDGKISTGVHIPGIGEAHFEQGEEFECTEAQLNDLSVGPDPKNPRDWVELA